MPRLWILYIEFLVSYRVITRTRFAVNMSLQALPITQHGRIWDIVINKFVAQDDFVVPILTCKRLFHRYLQYEPGYVDAYISYLISKGEITEAVLELIKAIEDREENLTHGSFFRLVDLIAKNANRIDMSRTSCDLPAIIRSGLFKFPDEQGTLWNSLADFYIRRGAFGKGVEVFEEAIDTVTSVSDFSIVFDSYQNFLELLVNMKMQAGDSSAELDLERLELLIERRDEMLSLVILRGNPNHVSEWIKRTKLPRIAASKAAVLGTFSDALATVNPLGDSGLPVIGRVSSLWIEYGKYLLSLGEFENFRETFAKAVQYSFKSVDELASVWIQWILLELKLAIKEGKEDWTLVLEVARRAISQYRGSPKGSVQSGLFRSVKLWHLVLDVEESVTGRDKPEVVRAIYESMMKLRVVTPQTILNYAQFEQDLCYFERSAKILENGTTLFPWPHCRDIWLFYLKSVLSMRKRFSTERVRDLFEQALEGCSENFASLFYFLFFKFEADHGLARNAIAVLLRAAQKVIVSDRPGFYYLAVSETAGLLGAGATRSIFEEAIGKFEESKNDKLVIELCMHYCSVEQRLGMVDRARALLVHASQFANPATSEYFWDFWKNLEITSGSEDTYKDMKRIRRSVEVAFSDKHFNTLDAGMEIEDDQHRVETEQVIESKPSSAGIDLSKLKQMAQLHKKGGHQTREGNFIPAPTFQGTKPGYMFTNGPEGTGYYPDT